MNSIQTVPAIQYDATVPYAPGRGGTVNIKEIFIPSINYIINNKGYCFYSEKSREHLNPGTVLAKEIHLPLENVEKIKTLAQLKFEVESKEKEIKMEFAPYFK